MNLRHPRVLAKYLTSRVTPVPNYCKRCGRRIVPFHVPDAVWAAVIGDGGRDERCIRCFTQAARRQGHTVEWRMAHAQAMNTQILTDTS